MNKHKETATEELVGNEEIAQAPILDGISVDEFNQLIQQFIAHEDPNAISLDALDEAMRQQLAEMSTTHIELTGSVQDGRIVFDPSPDAPILTHGNELIIGGLHVVVHLRETVAI